MLEKEFKIMIVRELVKIQEKIYRQVNEIRKTLHNLNDKFNKGSL